MEQAVQENIFVFNGQQPFASPYADASQAQPYPRSSYVGRGQEQLTPPYPAEGISESIRIEGEGRSQLAFDQRGGQQQHAAGSSYRYYTPMPMHGSDFPEEASTSRIQPTLQVQIPGPMPIPRINMPPCDTSLFPLDPVLSTRRSPLASNERGRLSVTPNISRPASSLRGPSPSLSSASSGTHMSYPCISHNGPLLHPVPRGPVGTDTVQLTQYISQQTHAFHSQMRVSSPLPGSHMGYQQSPSGSPYPPMTPITPSYSPNSAVNYSQLPQKTLHTLSDAQYRGQKVYASQSGDGLAEVHALVMASAVPNSPVPEQLPHPGYAETDRVSTSDSMSLGVNLVRPASSAAESTVEVAQPFPPSEPVPVPDTGATPAPTSTLPATTEVTKSIKEGGKAPSGRPRGRPKGSKNKAKVNAVVLGASADPTPNAPLPAKKGGTGKPRGRPRKNPLPQTPASKPGTTDPLVQVAPTHPVPNAIALAISGEVEHGVSLHRRGNVDAGAYSIKAAWVPADDDADTDADAEGEDDEDAEGDADDDLVPGIHSQVDHKNRFGIDDGPRKRTRRGSLRF